VVDAPPAVSSKNPWPSFLDLADGLAVDVVVGGFKVGKVKFVNAGALGGEVGVSSRDGKWIASSLESEEKLGMKDEAEALRDRPGDKEW
jgi:hypothetical protein